MKVNLSSFLQSRFNIFIFRTFGWTATYFYISLLSKLYFFLHRSEKWKIIDAIATVFSNRIHINDVRTLTREVFRGIMLHYYEKIYNAFSSVENLKSFFKNHIETTGTDALDMALGKGQGVLLVTGHFGGVEYIPAFLGSINYPVTIVVNFSSDHLRTMSLAKADKYGARIIDAGTTPNIIKAISSNLKENRIVIIQCDEIDKWRISGKDKIFFLSKLVYLDKTINVLLKRTAVPVVFGIMHRNGNHQYKFIATSWEEMLKKFQPSIDTTPGAVLLKFLEHYIYLYPHEWYQWKKYQAVNIAPASGVPIEPTGARASFQLLEPSLSNVA